MAAYNHAGSGWWRARPQQVVDVGGIICCYKKEAAVFGPTWTTIDPKTLGDLSSFELFDLANKMREEFYERHYTEVRGKQRSLNKIAEFIKQ